MPKAAGLRFNCGGFVIIIASTVIGTAVSRGGFVRAPKLWRLLPADRLMIERLSRELRISPVLAQLLVNRGLTECAASRQFLTAPLAGLHDPALLPGVNEAARRIHQAVQAGRRICVYGDYDVDGMTATTLLWRCLQLAGAQVDFYVPHRLEEGYGLNCEALQTLAKRGVQVVVTVDCGITSLAEAEEAKRLGLELIISDHHEFKAELPDAAVLVHPRLAGSAYPFRDLCGAGVAFKLAWAICREFSQAQLVSAHFRDFLLESLGLVALGTVADVMPVVDENRVFVRHGLKCIKEAPSVGLRALLDSAGLTAEKNLDAEHIGFTLAPRLNAAGRLGQARLAVELLATTSPQRAADLARYLQGQNELRQRIERSILHQARELIEAEYNLDTAAAIVLASPDWHPGVIGIVAGRLVERYARPVLLISLKEEMGQGSGRSIDGFHLHEALSACGDCLLSHGGHAAAAGFRIKQAAVESFRQKFNEHAARCLNGRTPCHVLEIDAEVPLSAMTLGLMKGIDALHPHGRGNARALFLAGGLQIVGTPRLVGGGERHVSFRVRQENGPILKAIAFNMADRLDELVSDGGRCCLVFTPKRNEWQGFTSVDLEVHDLRAGPVATLI
jgi:single-stranded-DNA-specific exonuclease